MLRQIHQRPIATRWALWAFAAALVLKAAMPWLASASAEMQGKALVEVCTAYGVSLVPTTDPGAHPDGASVDADHAAGHCALNGLGAFAGVDSAMPVAVAPAPRAGAMLPAQPSAQAPDACATWVARLKHGPPGLS